MLAREWCAPVLKQLCEDDAIVAQAALELRHCEMRRRAFGDAAADRAWVFLVEMFLAQSGHPVAAPPHAAGGDLTADLERRGLLASIMPASDGQLAAASLTDDAVRQLRAHFGAQLLDELALFSRFASKPPDRGDERGSLAPVRA